MINVFFEDEEIKEDDLYFMCYMIERVARTLHVRNKDVVNSIGYDELAKKISLASVLHCENPLKVVDDWIEEYNLKKGNFNILDVDKELVMKVPTETQMGKVYKRLIINTLEPNEDYIQGLIRVYNHEICNIIDNYNSSAYYEPTPIIVRSYYNSSFN
ncbi:hypothetical protein NNC19_15350 [Clostridium sp. SHJSY1]|uniref:hypothetical protein n=1 Tax=Clostridium sp. SHJSY1 TaxID=2942483 RepID=UPI002876BA77|nr:hypothetical protein [Clostridium sp. SHJSY1]MDS0527069.1 hypothetical protein [Clostridium sp. SHJSY1]